jgi:uncharacterized FAD-dependent dehydrogenase
MIQQLSLKLLPSQGASDITIIGEAAAALGVKTSDITGFHLLKRSIDARSRQAYFMLTLKVFINEPFQERERVIPIYDVLSADAPQAVIVGAGPAGLFAALRLIEAGIGAW